MYRTQIKQIIDPVKQAKLSVMNYNNSIELKKQKQINKAEKYCDLVLKHVLNIIQKEAKKGNQGIFKYKPWFAIFIGWNEFFIPILVNKLSDIGFTSYKSQYQDAITVTWAS